jgi:non-ribosomal peptide synthetase component F
MKYAALTLSTLSLAILAWGTVTMALKMGPGGRPAPSSEVALVPLSDQQVKDQTEVREALDAMREVAMSRMKDFPGSGEAQGLMGSSVRRLQPQFDSIFASTPPEAVKLAVAAAPRMPRAMSTMPAMPVSLPTPRVSLVLQTGNEGRAMVDGRLVRVGDPVAEGMVVKSISMESVVFAAHGEELVVAVPLERLRVLGAFPSPRAKGN